MLSDGFDAGPAQRRVARLLSLLAPALLVGCSLMSIGEPSGSPGTRPGGKRSPPFYVEPIYLDSKPSFLERGNLYRYACRSGEPLVCECTGRAGPCKCQCMMGRPHA